MPKASFMPTEDHGVYQAIAETVIVSSGGISFPEMNNLEKLQPCPDKAV